MSIVRSCLLLVALCAAPCVASADPLKPVVLYTDLASGPNFGGENGLGAYVSVFGKNFGSDPSAIKVTIGGVEVAKYLYVGASKGRADIQEITVQLGALASVPVGAAQPVVVTVAGVASNANVAFTINPGHILFVDNVRGDDASAVPDDIAHPYRHVQVADTSQAAYGAMHPGDIIVMRGTGKEWTDLGNNGYFVKFIGKDASAPTGIAGTGPFTLMAYPNEDVFIDLPGNNPVRGGLSGVDRTSGYSGGVWITIAGLRIESGGNSGVVAVQNAGDHWRVVNNDLSAASATNDALAGGINGNATNCFWAGNHIHDVAGGAAQENHGVYVDGDGSYEIAYNAIENVSGGNGIQVFADETDSVSNVAMHHNLVHGISKHGLNIAGGAKNAISAWNNVVYDTAYASLRFDTADMHGGRFYNNTFYHAVTSGNPNYGAITNDSVIPADALDLENNVVVPMNGRQYTGGTVDISTGHGTITNNLWFGGSSSYSFDAHAVAGDPHFADATHADFHLAAGSAAIDAGAAGVSSLVGDDYDAAFARPVGSIDIGAYEYVADYVYDRIFASGFE